MAEYPIYRLVKGTELTFTEMDNNLRWLSQNMSGSKLTLTGSSIGITGSVLVDGDVSVTGTITAKTLVVQTITSSVIYSSGSNIFGSNLSNTQTFTGSVKITGSGVYLTSGDFSGSGALLYNIPSTAIIGLDLSRISSGSTTASISPNNGLVINTSTAISGSLRATSSVFFPSLTTTNQSNVITVDTATGQLYYTASSALGSSTNIYNSDGTLTSNRTVTMNSYTLSFEKDISVNGVKIGRGTSSTFPQYNTVIGNGAYASNISGFSNTAVGYAALASSQYGAANSAFGAYALNALNGSIYATQCNTGIGRSAMYKLVVGQSNTGVGSNVFNNLTTGDYNTGIGQQAWLSLTSGSYNIIVGASVGSPSLGTLTGSYNTIIGSQIIGLASTLNNNIILADGQGNIKYRWDAIANNIYGQLNVSGSLVATSSIFFPGLTTTNQSNVVTINTATGQLYYTASSALGGGSSVNTGSLLVTASAYNTTIVFTKGDGSTFDVTISQSGSIATASYALYAENAGSASYALSASWAPQGPISVTGSTLYSNTPLAGINFTPDNSIIFGDTAGDQATNADHSNFIGAYAGWQATNANISNFIGYAAGEAATNAYQSNFIGSDTGVSADNANNSNFIGHGAGYFAFSASYSNFIGEYAGENAENASGSNFIGDHTGWSAANSNFANFIGYEAGYSASNASYSNFIGNGAGYQAINAFDSNFIGDSAGNGATNAIEAVFIGYGAGALATEAYGSHFIGFSAGEQAYSASFANFIGYLAGYGAANASESVFIGYNAGSNAIYANSSNFIGLQAGYGASSASYSTLIGYQVGSTTDYNGNILNTPSIGPNNIIIGTNISLPANTENSINLGAIIFATGSYSIVDPAILPYSGSVMGKVGINKANPIYNFDVSGSGNFTNGLTVTGSLSISGSTNSAVINNGFVVLTQVSQSLNFANDAAAAIGGVPLGGLYRNGNVIAIRIS